MFMSIDTYIAEENSDCLLEEHIALWFEMKYKQQFLKYSRQASVKFLQYRSIR